MPVKFTTLPHALSALIDRAAAPSAGEQHLRLHYDLQITKDGAASGDRVTVTSRLHGPGDVLSADHNAISRVEPRPGLRGFEPNYFPLLEFQDADFPWRYSLDTSSGTRKMPWIALIALQADEFSFVQTNRSPLKRITINDASQSLPDPERLWAAAHVHGEVPESLTGSAAENAQNLLDGDSDTNGSRLLCTRKLEATRTYYAFLVPVYEAGRLSGLGETETATPYDRFAWNTARGPVDLPVYFDWRFTTDEQEDIELLLRRLKALDAAALQDVIGDTSVSAADPGYFDRQFPGATFERQSAMQVPVTGIPAMDTPRPLIADITKVLRTVIEDSNAEDDDAEDPLVTFPPYGFRYKPERDISEADARRDAWFDRINLDLKFRAVAGLGAKTVRAYQEIFAHRAWQQYEDIVAANERLARLQMANHLTAILHKRHFAKLPGAVALTLAQPLVDAVDVQKGQTIRQAVTANGVPLSSAARSLRRLAAKRTLPRADAAEGQDRIPMPAILGDISQRRPDRERQQRTIEKEVQPTLPRAIPDGVLPGLDKQFLELFRNREFLKFKRSRAPVTPVQKFSSADLSKRIGETLTALPKFKSLVSVPGRRRSEQAEIRPVWRAPSIPFPMVNALKQVSPADIFAGADSLPDNTVAVVEENRPFVEAFLLGMNHEMNQELRWREFPTDMRGTLFRRFWDRGYPANDPTGDDIAPIHRWTAKIGRNVPQQAANANENLIVVIRGDIVRKLGDPILAINIAESDNGFEVDKGESLAPSFIGKLKPDTAYYGFEIAREEVLRDAIRDRVFFVIYEPAGQLRFGLDVGNLAVRHARRRETTLAQGFDLSTLSNRTYRPLRPFEGRAVTPAPSAAPPLSQVQEWDDLSWAHVRLQNSGYIDFSRNLNVPITPNHLGAAKTSASIARAFWQKPVAGILPLARVL